MKLVFFLLFWDTLVSTSQCLRLAGRERKVFENIWIGNVETAKDIVPSLKKSWLRFCSNPLQLKS